MQATQAPPLLTVPEFAAALRVHPASIYRRIQSGEIEARRIGAPPGGRFRISADELDRLLESVDSSPTSGADPGERRAPDSRHVEPPTHGREAAYEGKQPGGSA
jgi:excisionase family DNA binding protein